MTKKAKIIRAAAKLFAEKGFSSTSTSEIAEAAGVAHGTVFYHFKTKEGLLSYLYDSLIDNYLTGQREVSERAENGLDAVEAMLRFHFGFSDKYENEMIVMHRDMPEIVANEQEWFEKKRDNWSKSVSLISEAVRRGQEDGSVTDKMEAESCGRSVKSMMVGVTRMKYLNMIEFHHDFAGTVEFCISALRRKED
jgi:AcrR family transcriptional regulator